MMTFLSWQGVGVDIDIQKNHGESWMTRNSGGKTVTKCREIGNRNGRNDDKRRSQISQQVNRPTSRPTYQLATPMAKTRR